MVWAIALPAVGMSLYFYADTENPKEMLHITASAAVPAVDSDKDLVESKKKSQFSAKRAVRLLLTHFKESYSDMVVVQWSLWWALAACGFTQVQMYIQFLWQQINPDHQNVWNGAVEASLTLLGVFGAFAAGYMNSKRFDRLDLWMLTVCSALEGLLLLASALTDSVWVSYVTYVLFGMLFHFMITVARYAN